MRIEDEARAEAVRRYPAWHLSDLQHAGYWAFLAGAEWQASREVEAAPSDEVEWEYGIEDNVAEGGIEEGYSSEENALSVAAFSNHTYPASSGARAWAVKRVKAGPWIPVETAPERQE